MPWGYRGRRRDNAVRAAVLSACFAGLYLVGVVTPAGQMADDRVFGALASSAAPVRSVTELLRATVVVVLGTAAITLGTVSLLRRRPGPPVVLAATTLLAAAVSVLLRDVVLQRPLHDEAYGYLHNTFPSMHVTVTAALGVAVVALWPDRGRRERTVVRRAVLACVVLACLVNIATFAHRPTDVLGSVLLVGALTYAVGTAFPAVVRPVTGGTGGGDVRDGSGTAPRTGPRRARA